MPSNKMLKQLQAEFNRFKDVSQWIYMKKNILFSHAGISSKWLRISNLRIVDINNYGFDNRFGFTPDNVTDLSGTSETQPPTWIRPQSLVKCAVDNYIQVVGHTPVKKISNLKDLDNNYPNIWLCDNLPKQYLVIENNNFIVKNAES